MIENLTRAEHEVLLRQDFAAFAGRCFPDLNPQTRLVMNWHLEVIAAKLMEVWQGKIRRLIINLPPRHLKSLLASIAFPAWCLGHDPSAQFLSVSYAQDPPTSSPAIAAIMLSPWYRQIFPTRLARRTATQCRSSSPPGTARPDFGRRKTMMADLPNLARRLRGTNSWVGAS